jgi:hypothetical protein
MKPASILIPLLVAGAATGCDGEAPAPDAPTGPGIPITIMFDKPPVLVAFREGLDGAWQPAAMKTPTLFELEVHGPYVVAMVCEDATRSLSQVVHVARTPDDERSIMESCDYAPTLHAVTGRMLQAGRVQIGFGFSSSTTDDWQFNARTPGGTHDLMASTADRIVLRRAIPVMGPVAITPPIDVIQEGTALADAAFTATNATPTETLAASVHLHQPTNPFNIYSGPIATAKVVPDSLLAATDVQSVSIQATDGAAFRALRRPFRVGGDPAYTLPAPLAVQWQIAGGALAASWSALPEADDISVSAAGTAAPGVRPNYFMLLSSRFVAATGTTRATLDNDIPGFKPEWRIDFTREYFRQMLVQRTAGGVVSTSSSSETLNVGVRAGTEPPRPLASGHLLAP